MAKQTRGYRNYRSNNQLWDDMGEQWTRVRGNTYGISTQRASELFADSATRVGLWGAPRGTVLWAESPAEREQVWARYMDAETDPDLDIEMTEWSRPGSGRLLLFEERC
ncbi:hypothetical protein GCM10023075_83420 [Streptosporangium album]